MKSYKVGIVGVGVVGAALAQYIEVHTNHVVLCLDPAQGFTDCLDEAHVVFISVPVPSEKVEDDLSFNQNLECLYSAIESVAEGIPIVIRSTVLPGTCEALTKKYNRTFYHLPEFLTARRAYADMVETEVLYLGYVKSLDPTHYPIITECFPDKVMLPIPAKDAEMLKYAHNLHGAFKVTFWNGIFELCKHDGIDFDMVRNAALNCTKFINKEHTRVPGPDGQRGFGGTCFPVNLENFLGYSEGTAFNELARDVYALNTIYRGGASAKSKANKKK